MSVMTRSVRDPTLSECKCRVKVKWVMEVQCRDRCRELIVEPQILHTHVNEKRTVLRINLWISMNRRLLLSDLDVIEREREGEDQRLLRKLFSASVEDGPSRSIFVVDKGWMTFQGACIWQHQEVR